LLRALEFLDHSESMARNAAKTALLHAYQLSELAFDSYLNNVFTPLLLEKTEQYLMRLSYEIIYMCK
jgi:hypothetical protein